MSATPAVSVVIPVYGVEEWLAACLDSVLEQTFADFEVICVDDASPDGCGAILDAYAQRDGRIRVLHLPENHGQGYARNRGMALARGTWLYLLDSDDMIAPDALSKAVARTERDELDGLFFDSQVVFDTPELERACVSYPACHRGAYRDGVYAGPELFEAFMAQGDWTCYVQRQLWKREFLAQEGIWFLEASAHEDEDFAFRALLAAKRVGYLPEPLFIRRYRAGSVMTSGPAPKEFASYFACHTSMDRFARERGLQTRLTDVNLARIYEKLVRLYRQLSGACDLEALFAGAEERALYRLFASSQKAYLHYGNLPSELVEAAKAASHVYIYGAGVVGRNVFEALVREGVVIEGFFVTSAKDNPAALLGRPVLKFDPYAPSSRGTLVVVAMTEGYAREVAGVLDAAGWPWIRA